MKTRLPPPARGAATLLLVLGLVLLATLASAYSSRTVLADLLASQGLARATQARWMAQAALATAEAALLQPEASAPTVHPLNASPTACPASLQGTQWQCSALNLPTAPDNTWSWQATLARDLVTSPHVWQIHVNAGNRLGQASLRQSVFMPVLAPAPADTPTAALILNGCASEALGSGWQICPLSRTGQPCIGTATGPAVYSHHVPDTNNSGLISASERKACLAFASTSLPGGGSLGSTSSSTSRTPCNRAAWRSAFGNTTPEQLRAWSQAQQQQGLHHLSQPPRSIYWIDSPADWVQSLGSADAPVLLVFSGLACATRCPRLAAGTAIQGTVYLDAGCDDEKMRGWQAGRVQGQLVVEAGLPQVTGHAQVWATLQSRNAYILDWPEGIDPDRVQRVPGSRWAGPP